MPLPKRSQATQTPRGRAFYLGVDVGVQGGISLIDQKRNVLLYNQMPGSPLDLGATFKAAKELARGFGLFCIVENLSPMPQVKKSSAFVMGQGLGRVEASLACLGISYQIIAAKKWQAHLNLPARTQAEYKRHKERLRKAAQASFPEIDLWTRTLEIQRAVCDSLLIADYCRMENNK